MMDIYQLWFHHRHEDGCVDDMLLGVFSTREKAQQAMDFLRDKPGFRDLPSNFKILTGRFDYFDRNAGS